jgi:hypothetical protein
MEVKKKTDCPLTDDDPKSIGVYKTRTTHQLHQPTII